MIVRGGSLLSARGHDRGLGDLLLRRQRQGQIHGQFGKRVCWKSDHPFMGDEVAYDKERRALVVHDVPDLGALDGVALWG